MYLTGIIDEATLRFGNGKTLKISTTNEGYGVIMKLSVERDGQIVQKAHAWSEQEFRWVLREAIDPNDELGFWP